jgi:hypothetical protein
MKMEIPDKFAPRTRCCLLAALFWCAIATTPASVNGAEVHVRYMQNGETVRLAKGDTLVVRLPINRVNPAADIPFAWTVTSTDTDKLKLVSGSDELSTPPESGGPSKFQVFRFLAIGTGSVPLTMVFTGPRHFKVTIVVN